MRYLKQSTATTLLLGPFVDETDGQTAETALTISQADVLLWKEGGTTLAQKNESTACTHRSNGLYTCPVNATDTNTVGILTVSVDEAGAMPIRQDYFVLPANVYDSMILGTDKLQIDLQEIAGAAVSTSTAQLGVNVVNFGGTAGTFASGIPQASITTSAINAIADQVWDEQTSGHTAAGSYGQRLYVIRAATAQAGASTTITLDASASATDDFYNNQAIFITSGTGAGQGRIISDYVGATKVATVSSWAVNPSSDSVFVITPFGSIPGATAPTAGEVADAVWDEAVSGHTTTGTYGQYNGIGTVLLTGTAQAGTSSSITLAASGPSATDDLYNYQVISIIAGTGAGQSRQISDYNGTSKVATVALAWTTNPSSDSVYVITGLGLDAATVASIADAVWDEQRSGHVAAGSFGEYTNSDVVRISGDTGAADNAESFFDGTGYAGTNNVIPTVTTVTNAVSANVTQISGDSTAADNAEAFFDGTGYAGTNNTIPTVSSVTAIAAGGITASSLAADTITAAKIATDAITNAKIANGALTAAKVSGNLPANIKAINDTTVTGDGSGTPWGPA